MANLFIEVLRSHMRSRKFLAHDFVVMPNHVHVLLTIPGDPSIEYVMQLIKGSFSYRAARELGYKGEVWQRGFSDVRITNDRSFDEHRFYIAQNPVKAGLANTAEEFPFGSLFLKEQKHANASKAENERLASENVSGNDFTRAVNCRENGRALALRKGKYNGNS